MGPSDVAGAEAMENILSGGQLSRHKAKNKRLNEVVFRGVALDNILHRFPRIVKF